MVAGCEGLAKSRVGRLFPHDCGIGLQDVDRDLLGHRTIVRSVDRRESDGEELIVSGGQDDARHRRVCKGADDGFVRLRGIELGVAEGCAHDDVRGVIPDDVRLAWIHDEIHGDGIGVVARRVVGRERRGQGVHRADRKNDVKTGGVDKCPRHVCRCVELGRCKRGAEFDWQRRVPVGDRIGLEDIHLIGESHNDRAENVVRNEGGGQFLRGFAAPGGRDRAHRRQENEGAVFAGRDVDGEMTAGKSLSEDERRWGDPCDIGDRSEKVSQHGNRGSIEGNEVGFSVKIDVDQQGLNGSCPRLHRLLLSERNGHHGNGGVQGHTRGVQSLVCDCQIRFAVPVDVADVKPSGGNAGRQILRREG